MGKKEKNKKALRVADIADRLNMSIWGVYKWVQRQQIPHYRIPGAGMHDEIRFDEDEIESWLKKNHRKAVL